MSRINFNYIKNKYKKTKEKSLIVYFILRFLVILCMSAAILRKEWNSAFLCILSLLLFTIPTIIEDKLNIELPTVLESIIYLFIFSAEILGEINNFYIMIPHWDTVLHTLNGFLAAGIGFSLIDLLNKNSKGLNLSPFFVAVVAFCFSMTIGVLWEFFEYSADYYVKLDMQKDKIITNINTVMLDPKNSNKVIRINDVTKTEIFTNDNSIIVEDGYLDVGLNDTMKDLLVNFIGATCFSLFGYLYILNRDKYKFVRHFIPSKRK
ncbi:MAG: hypothetical protein IJA94_03895 [Bacilli bacterium]|nr:hypothetical protein [Bacilli bacterium]